tara:strand:- start:4478 stop:5497 length:1020 start_codon:yes stop_codon:yes gene_type:complete
MSLPPQEIPLGAMRFNSDSQKLEYWMGSAWMQVKTFSPNLDGGVRGIFTSRSTSPGVYANTADYVTISTAGDATDFGDTIGTGAYGATGSDQTRGLLGGGHPNSNGSDTIQFFTIASTGNATDFGNLTSARWLMGGGCSNSTRSIFTAGSTLGGGNPAVNTLDYVTTQSLGNAVDFGDSGKRRMQASVNSPTRGIWAGGYDHPAESGNNTIEFVTMASTGNTKDFGDLIGTPRSMAGVCNSTRGAFGGGNNPLTNTIQYITIASAGNAMNFGDLTAARELLGGASSPTRGIFAGGYTPSSLNTIDYIAILTTGSATNFGDLTVASYGMGGISNGHGGLG